MEDIGRIYIIKNRINNKVYIGKTIQSIKNRWYKHTDKWSNCIKLKNAINKLGKDNFYIEVIEDNIPYSNLDDRECYYINKYNSIINGYNIKQGNSKFRGRKLHKINDYIKDRVIQDYIKGISPINIAKHFKLYITSVYNILSESSIPKKYNKGGFTKNGKIDLDKFIQLKAEGYGTVYISKYFNVCLSSVKRYFNRHKDIILPRVSDILNKKDENVL